MYIKALNRLSRVIVAAVLLFTGFQLMADQPSTVPPRGKAYGYYMKDGTYILFVYVIDGTRSVTLSHAKPKTKFQLSCSEDLSNWQTLGTMVAQADGTAQYLDTTPNIPHRYYQVTRIP